MEFHLFSKPETWTTSASATVPVLSSFAVGALAPISAMVEDVELPFEPQRIAAEVFKRHQEDTVSVTLRGPTAAYFLTFARGNTLGLAIWGRIHKLADLAEAIDLISAVAAATEAEYGFADTKIDSGAEPLVNNPFGPLRPERKYWLNLFGPGMAPPEWSGDSRKLAYGGTLLLTAGKPS